MDSNLCFMQFQLKSKTMDTKKSLSNEQLKFFEQNGYIHLKKFISNSKIISFNNKVKTIIKILLIDKNIDLNVDSYNNINDLIKDLVDIDRKLVSYLYDGMKGLPLLFEISTSKKIQRIANALQNGSSPFLIDVNFRIDLPNESKFSFDWHQDFWYTHTDPNSLVFWIPFTDINLENGRLKVISLKESGSNIAKVEAETNFIAYNEAYKLKEEINFENYEEFDMNAGDVLIFKHSLFHKSGDNISDYFPRFTLQVRYSDYDLPVFKFQNWRFGSISRDGSSYKDVQEKIIKFLTK